MDVTRERISRILELREILPSFKTGLTLVNAILENISGLEPSSVTTEPRYLKLVTVSSFCPFTLIAVLRTKDYDRPDVSGLSSRQQVYLLPFLCQGGLCYLKGGSVFMNGSLPPLAVATIIFDYSDWPCLALQ